MDIFNSKFNFNLLSLRDLLEARELFHLHLLNKRNVVATAIGRYRIRKTDPWPDEKGYDQKIKARVLKEKTLQNSEVRDYSWPCILVFVDKWEKESTLCRSAANDLVPNRLYMPDGRIIPVCVIEGPKSSISESTIFETNVIFPKNYVGGGFPLFTHQQGSDRTASIGCVVTDGNKYFALTNKHVTGEKGTPIFTKMKGKLVQIVLSAGKELGKSTLRFSHKGKEETILFINYDAGLIEIEDINKWKTDVYGLGQMEELLDLNLDNLTLTLITSLQVDRKSVLPKVKAFGAVSGLIWGEIIGLYYRYKSLGGVEFVSDFLIGTNDEKGLNIHHGDSGTIWFMETEKESYPFAIHWGQHNIISENKGKSYPLGLASNLTSVCLGLDVDIVRGWNLDNDYSWGKTGHFKISAKACELVTNKKLSKLLMANQKNIGYSDKDLIDNNVISGAYSSAKDDFVPLADVSDIIWRWIRKNSDESNHYCDIDETNKNVFGNKSLIELCLNDEKNLTIDFWLKYYNEFDKIAPNVDEEGKTRQRDGALPFRVWEMYNEMVRSLKNSDVDRFICAGGTMSHYVGDACNSLHISYMHHGRDKSEKNVHSDYENKVLDKNKTELFNLVNNKVNKITKLKLVKGGKQAALEIIELMNYTITQLPPASICDSFSNSLGNRNRISIMWEDVKKGTVKAVARGCEIMALLWQSAWMEGHGDQIDVKELVERDKDDLKKLYNDKTFVPSFKLNNPKLKDTLK